MRLLNVNVASSPAGVRLQGSIERGVSGELVELYIHYSVPSAFLARSSDAFAAAMLLPAMRAGEPMHVVPRISPRLCVMLPRIRDVFCAWWPHLARIDLDLAPADADHVPPTNAAATYFSGGVDSFYTLLKHRRGFGSLLAPLTHVLFMRGVETRLEYTKGIATTESWIRDISAATGVEVITGESNVRTVLQGAEEHLHWERHYHGSALAAIALGLSGGLDYVCIPSAFSYSHLVPHGSTPMVDEMYSTDRLQIVHDGAEVDRPTKVARIIEWDRDLVLNYLRVCIENRGGARNCGRCRKCVRTAVPLYVLGVWDRASTFPDKSIEHWESLIAQDHLVLTLENLRLARQHGADRKIISMLTRAIARKRRHDRARALFETRPFDRLAPAVKRLRALWYQRR